MMRCKAKDKSAQANINTVIHTPSALVTQQIAKSLPKLGLLSIVISVLSACSTIPPAADHTTVIAEPQLMINQPYTVLDNNTVSSTKRPSIAIQRWQLYYTDPKLRGLIALALTNNKDLENALLAVKKVKAQYQISESALVPRINGGAGYTRTANHAADKNSSGGYSVNLAMASYELDFWGRIRSLKEQALQSYLATTAGKDTAQISVISSVAQMYVNLSYAKAQYELAKSTVKSREKSLFITQKRFEAGVDAKTPSLQASASLESAKSAMYEAETNIIKLRNALQLLIGSPIPTQFEPDAGVVGITNQKTFSAGLPSELLHYRPDILQAEYTLKATGANIDAARAAYFPAIRLTGQLGVSSKELGNLFKNSAIGWSFGPSISVPIFDAGQLDANYEIAQIQRDQALVSYEKSIQNAFKEVSDVLADRATLTARLTSQYKLQDNFNQTYAITNARFKSGLSDYLAVLDAERSLFATQQGILGLEQAKLLSQIKLYQVLGGGVAMDVPVELTMPNNAELVAFISANQTDLDASTGNRTVTSTNVARGASDVRQATVEDYREKAKSQHPESNESDTKENNTEENNAKEKNTEQTETDATKSETKETTKEITQKTTKEATKEAKATQSKQQASMPSAEPVQSNTQNNTENSDDTINAYQQSMSKDTDK